MSDDRPYDRHPDRAQPPTEALPDVVALDAPDLFAPVVAFRDFRLTDDGLASLRTGVVWRDRVLRAECLPQMVEDFARPPHPCPDRDCGCGIHARHEHSDRAATVDFRGVPAVVTVWGRIMASQAGMRAEYARIEALGTYERWTRRQREGVRAVARELDVDVVDLRRLPEAAARYGSPLPESLLPAGTATTELARAEERGIVVGTGA
jgi:hypothetical protein